jgi:glycerol-3-phosphate dehydrogenase (NAD(P)+)
MIGVIGAGAFGTALAVSLVQAGRDVRLWTRDPAHAAEIVRTRRNDARLVHVTLSDKITPTSRMSDLAGATAILISVPMQSLGAILHGHAAFLDGTALVACCKGVDLHSLLGPTGLITKACPNSPCAILTGPSFAADIARGLPTALTFACQHDRAEALQHLLSSPALRLYRTDDVIGAELGGALKNVIAIAAGIAIGAGLGESARAAVITRGYAEMVRLAVGLGARAETLAGLSGFGDLVLTCTSSQSRNFSYGLAIGGQKSFDAKITVEGAATAKAVARLAQEKKIDMPIAAVVAALVDQKLTLNDAIRSLLSRPLKEE